MNKATGKEVVVAEEYGNEAAVSEENHDDQKIAAKECDDDDVALKGRELVTAVEGCCAKHVVAKEGMVE